MKLDKFFNTRWFYRLLAAILAIVLFVYVNNDLLAQRPNSAEESGLTATVERTVSVPLELKADTEKYFITGYPEKVKITLTGPASLVTVSVNTLNFHVIADVAKLAPGTHRVRLVAQGLNQAISYKIEPATTNITIAPRSTQNLPIQVEYNRNGVANGYDIGTPKLSVETAQITGASSEVSRVNKLVATLNIPAKTTEDVEQNVSLQALDKDGKPLNVVINPATVHVTLPISASSKEIPVRTIQTGTATPGLTYTLTPTVEKVTVYGPRATIEQLSSVTVPVDVSGVTSNRTVEVPLTGLLNGVGKTTPETIKVEIKVTNKAAGSSSAGNASSSSSSDETDKEDQP